MYGSAASSTSVTKAFPDWAGPSLTSALGLTLADGSPSLGGDSGTAYGQDFIPIYLARAFFIENKGSLTVTNGVQSSSSIPVEAAPTLVDSSAAGNLVPGTTYTYAITAVLPNGSESLASPLATHVLGGGKHAITVSWVQSTLATVSGYKVYRLISGTQYEIFYVSGGSTVSFLDDGQTNGYYVGTLPGGGTGNPAIVVTPTLTPQSGGCLEAATWTYWVYAYAGTAAIAGTAAAGVSVTISGGQNAVQLKWTALTAATSYTIVKSDGKFYFVLTGWKSNSSSLLDDGLTGVGWVQTTLPTKGAGSVGTTQTYSLTPTTTIVTSTYGFGSGNSAAPGPYRYAITVTMSNGQIVSTGPFSVAVPSPYIPGGASYTLYSTVQLSWNSIPGVNASYIPTIWRSYNGGAWVARPTTNASSNTFVDIGLPDSFPWSAQSSAPPAANTVTVTTQGGTSSPVALVINGSAVASGGALDAGSHQYVLITTNSSGVQTGYSNQLSVTVAAGGGAQVTLPSFPNTADAGTLYTQPPGSSLWYSTRVNPSSAMFDLGTQTPFGGGQYWLPYTLANNPNTALQGALPAATASLGKPLNLKNTVSGGGSLGVYLAFVVIAVDSYPVTASTNYGVPSDPTQGGQYGYGAQVVLSWQSPTGTAPAGYVVFYSTNGNPGANPNGNNWFALPAVPAAQTSTQFTVIASVGSTPSSSTNPAGSLAKVASELQAELARIAPEANLPNAEVLIPFDNTVFGGHYSADGVYHPTGILDPAYMGILTPLQKQSKYASQTQFEKDALAALAARGRAGDPGIAAGRAYLQSLLNGVILKAGVPTPVTNLIQNRIAAFMGASVLPFLNAKSLYVGDTGPPLSSKAYMAGIAGVEIGRLIAEIDGENYDSELAYQNDGLRFAIQYGDQYYVDAEALRMSGLLQRQYDQGRLVDVYQIYFDNDTLALRQLAVLGSAVGGMMGLRNSITKPYLRPNDLVTGAGLLIAGASEAAPLIAAAMA